MKLLRLLVPVCLAFAPFVFSAEDPTPEHVSLMKEIGSLNGKLRKGEDVEATAKAMAVAGQKTLGFWDKKAPDAATSARNMIMASNMIASAAANKDATATADAMKMLGGSCKSCHDAHREKVGENQYKIK